MTVLMQAASKCRPDVLTLLLHNGADPDLEDDDEDRAIDYVDPRYLTDECEEDEKRLAETRHLLEQHSLK